MKRLVSLGSLSTVAVGLMVGTLGSPTALAATPSMAAYEDEVVNAIIDDTHAWVAKNPGVKPELADATVPSSTALAPFIYGKGSQACIGVIKFLPNGNTQHLVREGQALKVYKGVPAALATPCDMAYARAYMDLQKGNTAASYIDGSNSYTKNPKIKGVTSLKVGKAVTLKNGTRGKGALKGFKAPKKGTLTVYRAAKNKACVITTKANWVPGLVDARVHKLSALNGSGSYQNRYASRPKMKKQPKYEYLTVTNSYYGLPKSGPCAAPKVKKAAKALKATPTWNHSAELGRFDLTSDRLKTTSSKKFTADLTAWQTSFQERFGRIPTVEEVATYYRLEDGTFFLDATSEFGTPCALLAGTVYTEPGMGFYSTKGATYYSFAGPGAQYSELMKGDACAKTLAKELGAAAKSTIKTFVQGSPTESKKAFKRYLKTEGRSYEIDYTVAYGSKGAVCLLAQDPLTGAAGWGYATKLSKGLKYSKTKPSASLCKGLNAGKYGLSA